MSFWKKSAEQIYMLHKVFLPITFSRDILHIASYKLSLFLYVIWTWFW